MCIRDRVTPETYIQATDATALTPTMEFDQQRELGDGIYPGHTIKTLQKMDGSFNINVKADIITLLCSAMLGSDVISGESAPYTHVITPNESPSNAKWVTIVRDIASQVQEQFTDCRIKEIKISGETGNRITASVAVLGLKSEAVTLALTPSYEPTANMFMFYSNSTFTKDGTAISTISKFEITIRAIIVESDQTTGVELADAPVIRYEAECALTLDVDENNKAEYDLVYYSGGNAATSLNDGSFKVEFNNGLTGENERSLSIELHKLIYTAQPLESDASSEDQLQYEITAHCEKHPSNGLLTITTESSRAV
jgi:hypothetical protein